MTPLCREPRDEGSLCGEAAAEGSPVHLCTRHLLIAYDWVTRDVGVTDLLPDPCVACGTRVGVRYPAGVICAVCEWRVGEMPDSDLTASAVHVVYYLRLGDRMKIGTSGNLRQRLTAIPHDELVALELGNRLIERQRHTQFAADRLGKSEWFTASNAILDHAAQLNAGTGGPWANYALWRSRALTR